MSFSLLIITRMYETYLKSFYQKYSNCIDLSYEKHYQLLLNDTSEQVAAFNGNFNKLGVRTNCIIANDNLLLKKWGNENGIKVTASDEIVYEQIKKFQPNVLWVENKHFLNKEWLDFIKNTIPTVKLILGSHCSPYNDQALQNFRNLDLILTCTPGIHSDFQKSGLKSYLVYHAFEPSMLDKIPSNNTIPENDFVFSGSFNVGGGFHDQRLDFIEKILNENINLKIFGNLESSNKILAKKSMYFTIKLLNSLKLSKLIPFIPYLKNHLEYGKNKIPEYSAKLIKSANPPVFGIDMFRLIQHSKLVLNIHVDVAGDYAGNMRLFETTGVGSCLVTDNKKNMSDLFDCYNEVVVYDSVDDCIEKVKWLLENENERKRIANNGQKRTLKDHTVKSRCEKIIDIIGTEMKVKKISG